MVPLKEERAYNTDGVISRYHALLTDPFSTTLSYHGYIVGIEKSPRKRIGFQAGPEARGNARTSHDTVRLRLPSQINPPVSADDLERQEAVFKRTLNDPKVMFVSHIVKYDTVSTQGALRPRLVHSAYNETGFGQTPTPFHHNEGYERGWAALELLKDQVLSDIAAAKSDGNPFTHLVFAAMGWNNDQIESINRCNAILEQTKRAADADGAAFRPMFIGLTWPSVWGGTSVLDLANRALHLGSYPTKTDDSDEIGYGLANHIVHAMLPEIETATGLRSVLIGHSLGARMMSRAYYSADHLVGAKSRSGPHPTLIGLQAAFSANRFRADYDLIPPIRWVRAAEGGPYQAQNQPPGHVIMTWSKHDKANPVARFATGAAHVGGTFGHKTFERNPDLEAKIQRSTFASDEEFRGDCKAAEALGQVVYVDGSDFIKSHNDIRNPRVGQLVWQTILCTEP